ncbi:hypothetical protein GDO86_017537 [Hymenochirus boettgeri]|uniref:Uncharacterized protein n=1 Tax=Hymenochirus boettgeri TaxID=247094 RepID=A0A8T2IQT3_9PIPI|nr:hypothetical protein GDO86_017537 [Hymenochirus boettgeri]
MRKYRTDFNFGRDSLEARIKLAVLSHNHNICCKEVGQSMSIHPWEQERWIVNTAQGEKSNAHLRTLLTDLVKLCTGTLKPRWQPKSILPEVPCASSRLQQDFTVGEDVYSIVA